MMLLMACQAQNSQNTTTTTQKNDMIYLDELKSNSYTLKVGEKAYLSIDVHGSVGYWADYKISNEEVINLKDTQTEAYYPEKEGMPGGDKAKKTFIFEAKSIGTSNVTITRIFRGTTDKEIVFQIIVE